MTIAFGSLRGSRRPVKELLPEEEARAHFAAFLERHLLGGLLHAELDRRGELEVLPAELQAELRSARIAQWMQAEQVLASSRKVSDLFRGAGIAHLFLKGPLFSIDCYGATDCRRTTDVDVLVAEQSVADARALLIDAGYACHPAWVRPGRFVRRLTHHIDLRSRDAVVELHWTLRRQPGLRIHEASLWRDPREIVHDGRAYPVPSAEVTLTTILLGLASDLELGTARLRSVVDVATLLSRFDADWDWDWDAFLEARRGEGIEDLSLALMALVMRLWGEDAAPRLCARLAGSRESDSVEAPPPTDLLRRGLEIFDAEPPAWRNKRLLFPLYGTSPVLAWAGWGLSLPARLLLFGRD